MNKWYLPLFVLMVAIFTGAYAISKYPLFPQEPAPSWFE